MRQRMPSFEKALICLLNNTADIALALRVKKAGISKARRA